MQVKLEYVAVRNAQGNRQRVWYLSTPNGNGGSRSLNPDEYTSLVGNATRYYSVGCVRRFFRRLFGKGGAK